MPGKDDPLRGMNQTAKGCPINWRIAHPVVTPVRRIWNQPGAVLLISLLRASFCYAEIDLGPLQVRPAALRISISPAGAAVLHKVHGDVVYVCYVFMELGQEGFHTVKPLHVANPGEKVYFQRLPVQRILPADEVDL